MGVLSETAELAAKATAKQTLKQSAGKETMLGIDALAKGIESTGVSKVKTVDLVQLKKNYLAIKAKEEAAAQAAKDAAKKEGAAPAPKLQIEKDHEDLGPVIRDMQHGETARFDLSSGDSYTVTKHPSPTSALIQSYEDLQMGYENAHVDDYLSRFASGSTVNKELPMRRFLSGLRPLLDASGYKALNPLFDRIEKSPLSEKLLITGARDMEEDIAGTYSTTFHAIALNSKVFNDPKYNAGQRLYVIAHEATHGISVKLINDEPGFADVFNPALEAGRKFADSANAEKKIVGGKEVYSGYLYGLTNVKEFVAELYTRKAFQQYIKSIKEWEPLMKRLGATYGVSGAVMGAVIEAGTQDKGQD